MQTIIVKINQVAGNGCAMLVNNKVIASIYKDAINKGRYVGLFAHGTSFGQIKDGMRYPDAVEFVTDCIEKHFAKFGLDVEFVWGNNYDL